jgi:hypothetical protein
LKSTELATESGLWETVGMAKKYIPKIGDQVCWGGHGFARYLIVHVDDAKHTARVKNATGSPVLLSPDFPWAELMPLDESEVAAQIVKEATR